MSAVSAKKHDAAAARTSSQGPGENDAYPDVDDYENEPSEDEEVPDSDDTEEQSALEGKDHVQNER